MVTFKYLHKKVKIINLTIHKYSKTVNNINFIKYFHKHINIDNNQYRINDNIICRTVCENNNLLVVKYLHQEIGLTKQNFMVGLQSACKYNHINIVEYLHKKIGFNKQDFESNVSFYSLAKTNKCYLVVDYLLNEVKLTHHNQVDCTIRINKIFTP